MVAVPGPCSLQVNQKTALTAPRRIGPHPLQPVHTQGTTSDSFTLCLQA